MSDTGDIDWPRSIFADVGEDARYSLRQFRDAHEFLTERHEAHLAREYQGLDSLLQVLLDCLRQLEAIASSDPPNFAYAACVLGSKVVHHMESFRTLVNTGRYGDAFVCLRGVMASTHMLQYLEAYPDDLRAWVESASVRTEELLKGSRRAQLADKFSEGQIRRALETAGRPIAPELYGFLSEAAHATLWGMRFFAHESSDGSLALHYGGFYEPGGKAMYLMVYALALLPNATGTILDWNASQGRPPIPGEIMSRFEIARIQAERLCQTSTDILQAKEIMEQQGASADPSDDDFQKAASEFRKRHGRDVGKPPRN